MTFYGVKKWPLSFSSISRWLAYFVHTWKILQKNTSMHFVIIAMAPVICYTSKPLNCIAFISDFNIIVFFSEDFPMVLRYDRSFSEGRSISGSFVCTVLRAKIFRHLCKIWLILLELFLNKVYFWNFVVYGVEQRILLIFWWRVCGE